MHLASSEHEIVADDNIEWPTWSHSCMSRDNGAACMLDVDVMFHTSCQLGERLLNQSEENNNLHRVTTGQQKWQCFCRSDSQSHQTRYVTRPGPIKCYRYHWHTYNWLPQVPTKLNPSDSRELLYVTCMISRRNFWRKENHIWAFKLKIVN